MLEQLKRQLAELKAERKALVDSCGGNLNNAANNSMLGGLCWTKVRYQSLTCQINGIKAQIDKASGKPDVRYESFGKRSNSYGLLFNVFVASDNIGRIGVSSSGEYYFIDKNDQLVSGFRSLPEVKKGLLKHQTIMKCSNADMDLYWRIRGSNLPE